MRLSSAQIRIGALGLLGAIAASLLYPLTFAEASMGSTDKVVHAILFLVAAACVKAIAPRASVLIAVVIAVALGGLLELLQGLVGRDPSWGDLAADAVGAAIFVVVFWIKRRVTPGRRKPEARS
jgi:VanZ family protein